MLTVPSIEFVDGLDDGGGVHFVNFEALPDSAQQGDGEFAAEVFPKFFEAGQDD